MKAAELFVRCLENEGVQYVFGIPGEENIDVMDALLGSSIHFITTRHEQGAAFMADVYGRLTGRAGVCFSTLGPGATNLVTGVADANMDRAPVVAIAGQGATTRLHKESHQILDLVNLFEPISKYSTQLREPEIVAEVVRKAFKVAEAEKPGCSFIDFPENIAKMDAADKQPLRVQSAMPPRPPQEKIQQAAHVISQARFPLIMAGNGVLRAGASEALVQFAEKLRIPVANTFMAKGVIPFSHELALGAVGLQADDYVSCGFDRADVIICVGYDIVEYHPHLWHRDRSRKIVHIDSLPAEVDEYYILEVGVIGDLAEALRGIQSVAEPHQDYLASSLRDTIVEESRAHAQDQGFPVKPQKIMWDLRQVLDPADVVISDVGAHKMWMARMYQAERPNTCIISNGFAAMGIALPGAIAAKLAQPERVVVAVTGDAGFMMNSQEIETALRIGTPLVVLIWSDSKYGLIEWHQMKHFGRSSNIEFANPDFVKYAESFGAKGYRVNSVDELVPTLEQAIADDTVVIVDCPVDYTENMKLTQKLGELVCPI
ncbi:MAG: acetolactate synthase large subunit [Gammaproteobacteria bacterium]|nr:acetolactate synthase large subunit [Gammaproteobacteria bacterium]MDJ0871646.1 acetolactate synthase large subunit [Gammaproteobacteria bacterium]MDJ0891589.1 acetolactate synthase large subunit [Gammaproteobacteria bacterium]